MTTSTGDALSSTSAVASSSSEDTRADTPEVGTDDGSSSPEPSDASMDAGSGSSSGAEPSDGSTSTSGGESSESSGAAPPMPAPRASDDVYFIRQGEALSVAADQGILANDTNAAGTSVALIGSAEHVVLDPDGAFTFAPPPTFFGIHRFEYAIANGDDEARATVQITVAPISVVVTEDAPASGGFVIDGDTVASSALHVVAGAGDYNGDDFDDLLIGAPFVGESPDAVTGRSYVVFGGATPAPVRLTDNATTTAAACTIDGADLGDEAGFSAAGLGDLDHDGRDDIVLGVRRGDPHTAISDTGEAAVVFGRRDRERFSLDRIGSAVSGFLVYGERMPSILTAENVHAAGDVDGDGTPDMIVGSRFVPGLDGAARTGRAYVVFGRASLSPVSLGEVVAGTGPGFVIIGEDVDDEAGTAVSGAGDVNRDGLADVIVGARYAGPGSGQRRGRAYVVFGKRDGQPVLLSDIANGTGGGFMIEGELTSDHFGGSVSGAGDVNDDGWADVVIGAAWANVATEASVGRAYVVFGKSTPEPVAASAISAGEGGFAIRGEESGDEAGIAVAGGVLQGTDLDGDGLDDVLVGAWEAAANDLEDAGRVYVVYGKTDTREVRLEDVAAGRGGFVLNGESVDDRLGRIVDFAGDVNGDGFVDLVASSNARSDAATSGRSYVLFGGNYTDAVDFLGTTSDDVFVGTPEAESFSGGPGDDHLEGGGGHDVIYGGRGDDVIVVSDVAFARVDGGRGNDTLRFGAPGLALDLTELSPVALRGIEELDLGVGGWVRLRVADVGRAHRATLRIHGEDGSVNLVASEDPWIEEAVVDGWRHFTHGAVQLRIAETVEVVLE